MNKTLGIGGLFWVSWLFLYPVLAASQTESQYCVFEQQDRSKVASRIDWLSIVKCLDAASIAGVGWGKIEGPMTYPQASSLVDAMRVNGGKEPSAESDRFHSHCDHNYAVWKNNSVQPPKRSFSRADTNPGAGYSVEQPHLCCEDAAAIVFPDNNGGNDCRAFDLMSVPGVRVSLVNRRWVSLGGPVTINQNPPILLAPLAGAASSSSSVNWSGSYHGPCTYEDLSVNLKQTSEATMEVSQKGPQTLTLTAPGAAPLDLTITSDPATAKGIIVNKIGTAASGATANMEYTVVLKGDSLSLTMAAVTEGHLNLSNGLSGTHKGSAGMNCLMVRGVVPKP